ncbi:MAG: short-chain dehydrogenase [Acidimicrobiales bacterium]|nr:short-chain dehydrogenase [Acidimicrobiales bacterium]
MAITIDLAGRVALVTGGAKGVGRGITDRLAAAGATVVVCGRNQPDDLPVGIVFHVTDVRDPDAVDALVDRIVADHGRLDIAVNNAGGSPGADSATASPRFTEKILALNLTSAFHVAQAANRVMQGQATGGVIINVSSMSGLRPSPSTAAYGAAKAGLTNLSESLAMEWAPRVRVNTVSGGTVRTAVFDDYMGGPEGAAAVEATIPLGRAALPEDLGNAVVWLASDLATYVSGANIILHGGGERLQIQQYLHS